MRDVYVAGVGMTRFGKFADSTVRSLTEEAVAEALADATLPPGAVESAFFANAVAGILTGQEMIRGQVALRHTGILGVPIVNVENACASASSAFHLAWMAVASGAADVALAVGSEKLTHEDKAKSFAAIGTAVDLTALAELRASLAASGGDDDSSGKRSFFMDIYAGMTRQYMARSGATAADFAAVAAKNHANGALNPKAQYGGTVTVEDVLASREVSAPLTLLMCSPIGDGSAAAVLCSPEVARRVGAEVQVRASVLVSGTDRGPGERGAVERAAERAFGRAGVEPSDLDVVEVHDAAAPAELMVYEELGLCPPGGGPKLLASGDTRLGGRVPVNPSGGLLSKGHPIGATGCAQIVELVDQLRGRCGERQVAGARVAAAENGGGFLGTDAAACVVTVLSR
ncbi:MAG: thiolase family protein [Acidimicrobiia bacterium]